MGVLRAYGAVLLKVLGCVMDQHEYVLDASVPGVLRLRCLHCSRTTPGVATAREGRS